jgi:hypothetical protein
MASPQGWNSEYVTSHQQRESCHVGDRETFTACDIIKIYHFISIQQTVPNIHFFYRSDSRSSKYLESATGGPDQPRGIGDKRCVAHCAVLWRGGWQPGTRDWLVGCRRPLAGPMSTCCLRIRNCFWSLRCSLKLEIAHSRAHTIICGGNLASNGGGRGVWGERGGCDRALLSVCYLELFFPSAHPNKRGALTFSQNWQTGSLMSMCHGKNPSPPPPLCTSLVSGYPSSGRSRSRIASI